MPMLHARLSPSSSARWLQCTASVEVSEQYENATNSSAEWGTNVHYIGEQLLLGETIREGDRLTEGDRKPFVVDEEMLETAEDYADYCRSLMTPKSVVMVEEKFDLSVISENQFGTSDCTILDDTHLHIIDLKTGRGIVMAEENTQLMLYAIGAVEELELVGHDITEVTLHIAQHRAGHIDEWTLSYDKLMDFKEFAQIQAKAIISGETEFNPSKKACQWCPHQTSCTTLKAFVDKTISAGFDDISEIDGQADKVDTEHIAKILEHKDLIIGFIKAVEERALELALDGEEIKGFKVVAGKTNRKWADEEEVAKYLHRKIPANELWVKKLLPMSKILKLRPKDKKLEEMLIKPEGKPTLVKLSDKRAPLSATVDDFEEC